MLGRTLMNIQTLQIGQQVCSPCDKILSYRLSRNVDEITAVSVDGTCG